MLKRVAFASLGAAIPGTPMAAKVRSDTPAELLHYLERHAKHDGGYGWEDQERSHLTPTFAVIGCYHALKQTPPRKASLAEYVHNHHPAALKKLEQEHRGFEFQQIQSLVWLGEDSSAFRAQVVGWRKPAAYMKQYEQKGHPIFRQEVTAFTCRALLNMPVDDLGDYVSYLESRRRSNGSFNNTPAADGGDGHVINTFWGLEALRTLGRLHELKGETIKWLRACQLPGGAFTWAPQPGFAGIDDAAYTWAALRALRLLGAQPNDPEGCANYLWSLATADGGFSDRPGWLPNPMATFYALESLATLEAMEWPGAGRPKSRRQRISIPKDLKVFSIQIEAHGQGSPIDAVNLAGALNIHLWGAKNASPEWLGRAQAVADRRGVPVTFLVSNEEYGTWVNVPGFGTYSHTSDIIAPAKSSFGESLARKGVFSWPEFRDRRLKPLQKAGGRLIWQFGENEELVRLFLDDSVERGGYAAISTFHFGNPDFTNSEPFLQRYRGQIPFVALQDAHGNEPWWFADKTTGFRTLFLGRKPTWDAWLEALSNNWTAAVRHDAASNFETWVHAGSREVLDLVWEKQGRWRWWNNPQIQRPLASLAVIRPDDLFETGHPDSGVVLRTRCAWECAAHGQLKSPIAELVKLRLDGREITPELVVRKPKGAAKTDEYHEAHLTDVPSGKHTATAEVRELKTGLIQTVTEEFLIG